MHMNFCFQIHRIYKTSWWNKNRPNTALLWRTIVNTNKSSKTRIKKKNECSCFRVFAVTATSRMNDFDKFSGNKNGVCFFSFLLCFILCSRGVTQVEFKWDFLCFEKKNSKTILFRHYTRTKCDISEENTSTDDVMEKLYNYFEDIHFFRLLL